MKDCELELQSMDGKCISARYFAPLSVARGSLIVVQEIFGVNAHIAQMCEQFSHLGFHVIAPRFFDRAGTDIQLDYSEAGIAEGRRIVSEIGFDNALRDVHAAAQHLRQYGAVGVVGYCWAGRWHS